MSDSIVLYETSDGIATVTLNRPERMNTINDELSKNLYDVMQHANTDRNARVIIVTGAGKAFCAGGDVHGFGSLPPKALPYKLPRLFDMNERPDYQTRHAYFPALQKPVIGMINGACAGLGMSIMLSCDVRFASDKAVFATAFAKIGLSAEYGTAWILQRIVGHANALDLLLSGRKIDAAEGKEMGLYNKVFPADELVEKTRAYARDMAELCAPRSLKALKRQVWDAPFQSLHEAVMWASRDLVIANGTVDFKEGAASFREKRKPTFRAIEDVEE